MSRFLSFPFFLLLPLSLSLSRFPSLSLFISLSVSNCFLVLCKFRVTRRRSLLLLLFHCFLFQRALLILIYSMIFTFCHSIALFLSFSLCLYYLQHCHFVCPISFSIFLWQHEKFCAGEKAKDSHNISIIY